MKYLLILLLIPLHLLSEEIINFKCDVEYDKSGGFWLDGVMKGIWDTSKKTKTYIYNKSRNQLERPTGEIQRCFTTDSLLVCSNTIEKATDGKHTVIEKIEINRATLDFKFVSFFVDYVSKEKTGDFWTDKGHCKIFNGNQF